MPSNSDFDTDLAAIVTQEIADALSNYADAPDSLLGKINVIGLDYGDFSVRRRIAKPHIDVSLDQDWADVPEQQMEKEVQRVDFKMIQKRLTVTRRDLAGDPQNVAAHVRDAMLIVKDAIEKFFIEGASTRIVMHGVSDYPNATLGTLNRPEMACFNATKGDWSTTSNLRTDLIKSMVGLLIKRFYGEKLLLLPTICKPMMAELTTTGDPQGVGTWVTSTFGIQIAFSPFVHEAATSDDFNGYMIDRSKVHIGLTDIKVDQYYDDISHQYFWDFEVGIVALFDPLNDGTEWLKGVCALDARDWID